MLIKSAVITDKGKIRLQNQDNYYMNGSFRSDISNNNLIEHSGCLSTGPFLLYAVADGMGGERHGELASLMAVSRMQSLSNASIDALGAYIDDANTAVCDIMNHYNGERTGTTVAMLAFEKDECRLANIGDSRIYRVHEGEFSQISKDHTVVSRMVEMGVLTPEAAAKHSRRHVLSQNVGIFPEEMIIEPYYLDLPLCCGDKFLICSDGLTDMVTDEEISAVLATDGEPDEKVRKLYEDAMENGGKDNITVMLLELEEPEIKQKKRRWLPFFLIAVLVGAILSVLLTWNTGDDDLDIIPQADDALAPEEQPVADGDEINQILQAGAADEAEEPDDQPEN